MPTSYRPCEADQVMLLAAVPHDGLPPGHLAYFIHDAVGTLHLSASTRVTRAAGRAASPFIRR